LLTGKIIPIAVPVARETTGTAAARSSFHQQNQPGRSTMYIGLGGLLILILVLWLLGVI
jgi:hypothetical protein